MPPAKGFGGTAYEKTVKRPAPKKVVDPKVPVNPKKTVDDLAKQKSGQKIKPDLVSGKTWKPSMTKAEAEAWGRDSKITGTMYHGSTRTNLEGIGSSGFDLNRIGEATGNQGMNGRGAYFSPDLKAASGYMKYHRDKKDRGVGEFRINVKNPIDTSDPRYAPIEARAVKSAVEKAEEVRGRKIKAGSAEESFAKQNYLGSFLTEELEKAGFDSVVTVNLFGGGREIAVFDPEKIVMVAQ